MSIKTQTFTGGGGGAVTGGLVYKGTFNATTGAPSLANAEQGDYYKIATAGTIYGQTWDINDSLLINADMGGSITNSKIDKIDNTEPTNVLITTNNLNDLDNVATAKTNLGLQTVASTGAYSDLSGTPTLGTAAAANTGTGIGQVVIMEDVGSVAKLPALDGSQLINITANDSTRLAKTQNLNDLTNKATARTNLGVAIGTDVQAYDAQLADVAGLATTDSGFIVGNGSNFVLETGATVRTSLGLQTVASTGAYSDLSGTPSLATVATTGAYSDLSGTPTLGTAAAANTGTGIGQVVIMEDVGSVAKLPALDGSQLTGITATDSTKLAIANNLSDLNSASTSRTNLGLGTAATLNSGTGSNNLVQLNGSSQLPAVDGSNLTNVGKFTDYTTLSSNSNIFKNKGYNITANSLTLTLPARSTVTDGDSIAFTSAASYSVTIQLNSADTATSNIFYNVGSATNASSHTITLNKQEIFIRYNGSSFLITSETKGGIADVVSDTSPQLGGSLDVNGQDIVSVSNGDIEVAPDGNGSFIIKGNATSGSGRIVLNCEQNSHGITLKGPAHSAGATYQLVLPTSVGTDGQVLKTDGGDSGSPNSVQLAWVDQASGGGGYTYSAITSTTSAQLEYHYSCGAGDETFTLNLPAVAGGDAGKEIRVKNMGTGTITIDGNSSSTIDGQATITLDVQFSSVTLVATGNASASWEII